jgi:hypothetical protein
MVPDDRLPKFALPGTWGRIDLATEASIKASVRALVDRQVGKADDRATLRAELRDRIVPVANQAREKGGVEFHLSQEIVPGVPFGASLALFVPELDLARLGQLGLDDLRAVLEESLGPSAGATPSDLEPGNGEIRAVRHIYRRTVPAADDAAEYPILEVDYWIAAARPARIATMSFATAFAGFEDLLLDLFDAIVETVRWPLAEAKTTSE